MKYQKIKTLVKRRHSIVLIIILFCLALYNCSVLENGICDNGQGDRFSFQNPVDISNCRGDASGPQIVIDHTGEIIVTWMNFNPITAAGQLFSCHSPNKGTDWGNIVIVSPTLHLPGRYTAAVDGTGKRFVIWENDNFLNFCFCRWINGGWSSAKVISTISGLSPGMAMNYTGNIHVVSGGGPADYFRSTDYGATWSRPVNISRNENRSYRPVIVVDSSGILYAAWSEEIQIVEDREIFSSCSYDNGKSWSKPVNISDNAGDSHSPALAVDNAGNISAVWIDDANGSEKVYFSKSSDNGSTWAKPVTVSTNADRYSPPAVAVDNAGNINLVWAGTNNSSGMEEVLFKRSTDQGATWEPVITISDHEKNAKQPAVAVDETGRVYIVYSCDREIFFTCSKDYRNSKSRIF